MTNPLDGVNSWLYHLGNVDAAEAARIGANNAGLVVIDYAHDTGSGTQAFTPVELEVMRGGGDKLIVSYLSIGEAEDYRPYWQSSWASNPPDFLSASNPEWPDNFKVKYWDPAWQAIIFDYVDKIIASGFNGVYMDIIDAYQYWEDINPVPGMNYAQEMANFVAAIRAHAEAKLASLGDTRDFAIMGQNGEELLANQTYLNALDGVGKEDLRFYYPNGSEGSFQPTPNGWFSGSTPYLEQAEAAGVQVFVVEYMTQARQTQYSAMLASEIQYLVTHGIPLYVSEDRDLTTIYPQPPVSHLPIYGTAAGETVGGTIFDDVIYALAGNDIVNGSDGNDMIAGGSGADVLRGGTGSDTASYDTAAAGVTANLRTPASNTGDAAGDSFDSIENLLGSAYADVLEGNDGANLIVGGAGNDTLRGGLGNDVLDGSAGADILLGEAGDDNLAGADGNDAFAGGVGNDRMDGGAGIDIVDYSAAASALYIDLRVATQANTGGLGTDVITTIENVIGGAFADVLIGFTGNDTLYGGAGADALVSVEGDDSAYGGAGDDYIAGRAGNDTLYGGLDKDTMDGGLGSDILRGDSGDDFMIGGDGNDTIHGGDGATNVGDIGDRWLGGDDGDDSLFGNLGADRLSGGAGNDSLTGGEGADFLTGEAGVDTFIYNALSEGSMSEQIGDWQGGIDKLQIDASAFGGGLAAGALAANRLVIGTMANQAFGQFLYNNANGVLYWDADGTGAGAATAFTRLFTTAFASPPATLAAADFLIVV